MANNDGKITLGIQIDASDAKKSAESAGTGISSAFKKAGENISSYFKKEIDGARQTRNTIKDLEAALADSERILQSLNIEYAELLKTSMPTSAAAQELASKIELTEKDVSALSRSIKKLKSQPSTIKKIGAVFSVVGKVVASVGKGIANVAKRIGQAAKRVFVFRVLYALLTKIKEYFGEVLSQDAKVAQDWEAIKKSISAAIEPIVAVLLPVVRIITDTLSGFAANLASAMSSVSDAASAEKSYEKMAKSSDKMAENAKKQVASFDDIEVLSSTGSDTAGAASGEPLAAATGEEAFSQAADFAQTTIGFVQAIIEQLPALVEGIIPVLGGLIEGIIESLPEFLPSVIMSLTTLVVSLVSALPGLLVPLITALPGIISDVLLAVTEALPLLINAALDLVVGLVAALPDIITALVDALPGIVSSLIYMLLDLAPTLINVVLQLILSLVATLPSLCGKIASAIPAALRGVIDAIKKNFNDNIKPMFSLDFWKGLAKNCANGLIAGFEGGVNGVIELFENMLKFVIDGINLFVGGLDKIVGAVGNIFGADWEVKKIPYPNIPRVSLPRLATGGVIPPNREFLAVLGDQKSGTNIEAPLSTIQEAVASVVSDQNAGIQEVLADILNAILSIEIGDEVIGRAAKRYSDSRIKMYGG